MAEVLEHLHTSPALVLGFLRSLLGDSGILVVQTPNAAALHKRVKLLLGRNPYTLISEDLSDPLHFREYTMEGLDGYLSGAGFEIMRLRSDSYFDYRYPTTERRRPFLARLGVVNLIYGCLPARLKPGFTVVARARA
jgi:hypothetical protein